MPSLLIEGVPDVLFERIRDAASARPDGNRSAMLRELLTATYGDPPFPPRVVGWLRLDRVGELDVDEPCPECGLPMDEVWAGLLDNGQWVGPRCPLCAATEP